MIKEYFKQFNIFSEQYLEELSLLFTPKTLHKADYFIKEGEHCKEIAFITSGIFRSFYLTEDGKESTFCFRFTNDFLTPYSAFISGNPSMETMQAITDANLLIIKKEHIDQIILYDSNWLKVLKFTAEYEYIELEKRFFQLQRDTASTRYKKLLENHPEYIKQIPLQYLASYLGVTQRHLSRIRKEIHF